MSLLICIATEMEGAMLRAAFADRSDIHIVCTGVGPVNAAHGVTMGIVEHRPSRIVVCGVGGAYPGSGLTIGDVVCADVECYGDLGAQSPGGFLDMRALGFPVIRGDQPVYNDLPLQVWPVDRRVKFVTVNTCTGTDEDARSIEARTGGAVENMEGAAVAHVARLHEVPVGEVRGISNIVTTRDTSAWRLKDAAVAAQEAVIAWLARQ